LKALVNEFNERGYVAVYTKFSQLLWYMKQVFGRNGDKESFIERYNRLKRVPMLGIDEFDKANMTDFAMEFQFDFVDDRYVSGLRGKNCWTVFITNTKPDDLPGYLESRIKDGRCTIIENKSRDLRPHLETGRLY